MDFILDRWYHWKDRLRRRPWEARARKQGLFPVWADWIGYFVLDANGVTYFTAHTEQIGFEPVLEPNLRHVTLALASDRYRKFRALRPARTESAIDCPSCNGQGKFLQLPPEQRYKMICQCGGTGWVEPEWQTPEYNAKYPPKSVF